MVPAWGPCCWERKHLEFWAEWAGLQVSLGWEEKEGVFPKQTLWLFSPTEASTGLGGAQAQCFLGGKSCQEPSTLSAQGSSGGLCSCRTVSGPEPSSPPGSLSSGPALGLPPALCLPSSEEMEDFSHCSGLSHLTILLLLLPLPTGGSTGECVPTPFLCGSPGAVWVALSTHSGWAFEEPLL